MVQHWVQVAKTFIIKEIPIAGENDQLWDIFFQLGHDGLATEAGFPPDDNVEVYDAWYGLPQVCIECW